MNKSILLLEENSVIHGLVGSALDIDGLTLHHEFNPDNFVERAKSLMPDLIIISNVDQGSDYTVCRELKGGGALGDVPLILLANSNESIDPAKLAEVHVDGVVRKPFEASDLQQQVSKHLDVVDLIGSAYEYRQSQSIDDKPDPLADLQVVDAEILGLLQGAGDPAAMGAGESEGIVAAGQDDEMPMPALDEQSLEETLQPEAAFEPVQAEPAQSSPAQSLPAQSLPAQPEIPVEPASIADEAPAEAPEEEQTFSQMHGIDEMGDQGMDFGQEETVEELGAADLLEEESEEAAPPAFDHSLDGEGVATADSLPLEQIEVEISDGQVDLDALDDDLQQEGVELFEPAAEEAGEGQAGGPGEDIPLAVRRMMELKPIFSSQDEAASQAGEEAEEDFASLISSEGETGSFDDDLGTLDEIELDESLPTDTTTAPEVDEPVWTPVEDSTAAGLTDEESTWTPPDDSAADGQAAEPLMTEEESTWTPVEDSAADGQAADDVPVAAEPEAMPVEDSSAAGLVEEESTWTPPENSAADGQAADEVPVAAETEAAPVEDEEEEEFSEELLGDEELDEDRILAAMQEAEAEDAKEFGDELEDIDSDAGEMDELVALSEEDLGGAPAVADAGEEESELMLDQDEEAMMMASLEEDAAFAGGIDDTPTVDPQLEQIETEAMGELEELEDSISEIEGMEPPAAPGLDDIAQPELSEPDLTEPGEAAGTGIDDEDFSLSVESEGESPFTDDLSVPVDEPDGLGLGVLDDGLELDDSGDDAAEELAQQDISEYMDDALSEPVEGGELPLDDSTSGDDLTGDDAVQEQVSGAVEEFSDFEEELLGLKDEIEANPEGERISDLLETKGVKTAVDDLEFELPQEEHNLTRAMGISDLPGGDGAAMGVGEEPEALDEPTFATPMPGEEAPAIGLPSLDAHAGTIDDAMKARLGEVLDEMITASVRKAVQEEIPKLMEQLEKDKQ